MRAVVLVGHGSLRGGSGAAMIRLAARLREAGVAPIVAAGFLNYSKPPLLETIGRCVAKGASEIVVAPYFLVPGKFVLVDVPRQLAAAERAHPGVRFELAPPLGDHPALARLVARRAAAIESAAPPPNGPRALLLMAHGSPRPASNAPIHALAAQLAAEGAYVKIVVCFMDLNEPSIGAAIDGLAAEGIAAITAVPFFLQLGGHVAEDLPAAIEAARERHPAAAILLSEHLAYDPLLCAALADRVREAG